MRWLITGAGGMLGHDAAKRFAVQGWDVVLASRAELDITDAHQVADAVAGCDAVLNCAAYTAVDAAETDEAAAFAVNATGAGHVARAARGKPLVHVSTDYVFAGDATEPYAADAPLAPTGAYGRTKAAGEWAVRAEHDAPTILRTAYLYGAMGKCFPKTIARVGAARGALSVVADQVGQPTWTADVADLVVDIAAADAFGGTFHATSGGQASWWEFAREVVATAGLDREIVAQTTAAEFGAPAPRPAFSVLSHDSLTDAGVTPVGDWRDRWAVAGRDVLAGVDGVTCRD